MKQFKRLLESLPSNTVVFAFGRFNPPTVGHELLVKLVKKIAKTRKADYVIYASRTTDKKKNPLTIERKLHFLNMMFPGTTFVGATATERTPIEVAKFLNTKYKNVVFVAGSDRVESFKELLNKYNGKEYNFDSIEVISAGERDPDADDASGMSASKMRAAAQKGDFDAFKQGLPSLFREIDAKQLMNDVRVGMGLEAIKEQIRFEFNELREQYISKQIFNIGECVQSGDQVFEIIDRGANYLTLVDYSGSVLKKWLHECKPVDMVKEDVSVGYAPSEITFKNYTTKNLHHSEDAAKAFQDTISRYGDKEPATILAALKATDAYMKLNDMHLEQEQPPDKQEVQSWLDAHTKARDSLQRIGEFMHHEDYWHMHEHELQDMMTNYTPETAGAEMADSYTPLGNQLHELSSELLARYKKKAAVAATAADKEGNVQLGNKRFAGIIKATKKQFDNDVKKEDVDLQEQNHPAEEQVARGLKAGYGETTYSSKATGSRHKVTHDGKHYRSGMMRSSSLSGLLNTIDKKVNNTTPATRTMRFESAEEEVNEELTDKTIRSGDKIKVARVIADMLGVENAESMAPDLAINTGLRKIKSKRLTPEFVDVIKKMLALAHEVGIKVDTSLIPKAVAESTLAEEPVVNRKSAYNLAGDILRYKDFLRLQRASRGIDLDQNNTPDEDAPNLDRDENDHTEVGHSLHNDVNPGAEDHVRRMKVKYKVDEEVDHLDEDVRSADYKVNPETGRKFRAHVINFKNSAMGGKPQHTVDNMQEESDVEPDMDEDDIDDLARGVDDIDDILDLYDDHELVIVDADSGEHVDDLKEEMISEVLSRMERVKAKIRFARTQGKRERRLQVVLKSRSSPKQINSRARRLAVNLMKERIMRKPVATLNVSEKERVEKIIERRKTAISRLAMKLAPRIRKIENDRLSHSKVTK